jgi:hypothetical protein
MARRQTNRKTTGQRRSGRKTATKKITLGNPGDYNDEINQRAYEIYLQRGEKPGDDISDWLRAEKEVKEKYSLV